MEVKAIGKYLRVPPRKARLIADQVRGMGAVDAQKALKFMPQDAARIVYKVLSSAIANADNNFNMSVDSLRVRTIMVDDGPRLKRIQPRAMGRAFRILKRMSHITIVLDDSYNPPIKKKRPQATKHTEEAKAKKSTKVEPTAETTSVPASEPVEATTTDVAETTTSEIIAEQTIAVTTEDTATTTDTAQNDTTENAEQKSTDEDKQSE